MSDERPLARLFLDVDGVLNAVNHKFPDFWGDWQRKNVNGFPIRWAPAVPAFIRSLHPRVEILWLTTWGYQAHRLDPVMDLPYFPVAGESEGYEDCASSTWWKLLVLQEFPHDVPVIWVDDDIKFEEEAQDWLASLPVESLAVSPESTEGIRPDHVEQICKFIETLEWDSAKT